MNRRMPTVSRHRPFHRVLIANRGEIAVRIIRTLREMDLESVAVFAEPDIESSHVSLADFAVPLKGRALHETYLSISALVDAIRMSKADAVHPGYGFLSENADFVRAVEAAGAVWIGPSAEAMSAIGNKIQAKVVADRVNVPRVPGNDGPLPSAEAGRQLGMSLGYPLLLKAAAGGGGRGMRVVRAPEEFDEAFGSAQRESQASFGSPVIFCERRIEEPRHVEVQILRDSHGHTVHLFERDCSLQRRHQKLLEEAPSPFVSTSLRETLGAYARSLAEAVDYTGAGTVEFVVDAQGRPYFIEMNTRIQVEHPVTEAVTGVDLIAEQIRIAQGHALSVQQSDLKLNGWAMEMRINAEDPQHDFAPGPGRLQRVVLPGGPGVRVDSHLASGLEIPPEYDSMIAKIIVWGPTREHCRLRALRALRELAIDGVPSTATFHEWILQQPAFREGRVDTGFVDRSRADYLAWSDSTTIFSNTPAKGAGSHAVEEVAVLATLLSCSDGAAL